MLRNYHHARYIIYSNWKLYSERLKTIHRNKQFYFLFFLLRYIDKEVYHGVGKNENNENEENNNKRRRRVDTFLLRSEETIIIIILRKRKRSRKNILIIKKYLFPSFFLFFRWQIQFVRTKLFPTNYLFIYLIYFLFMYSF